MCYTAREFFAATPTFSAQQRPFEHAITRVMDRVKGHDQTAPASSCKVYVDGASILAYGGGNISRPRYNIII